MKRNIPPFFVPASYKITNLFDCFSFNCSSTYLPSSTAQQMVPNRQKVCRAANSKSRFKINFVRQKQISDFLINTIYRIDPYKNIAIASIPSLLSIYSDFFLTDNNEFEMDYWSSYLWFVLVFSHRRRKPLAFESQWKPLPPRVSPGQKQPGRENQWTYLWE